MLSAARCVFAMSLVSFVLPASSGAEPFRYPPGKQDKAELAHVRGLPVLCVEGDPEELGAQIGLLAVKPAARLLDYPRDFLGKNGRAEAWPRLVAAGKEMLANFPREHLRELEATVKATGLDRDLFVAANTLFDMQKPIACSVLMVEGQRSAGDGPLFGRNLDFPTLGYLHEYTLVTVYRPKGKRAFVSVGFPGLVGCVSGMNDAGLTLAVLEVYATKDESPVFDPQGTPYALCFRRLLEECTTVDEAEKALRAMKRTTRINLAVCDMKRSAVFEITPKSLVVRNAVDGICACTNHFRTRELATAYNCRRYDALEESRRLNRLNVAEVQERLHAARQDDTHQTMVFEPAALKLHLACGKCPSSALPLKTVELAPLFRGGSPQPID